MKKEPNYGVIFKLFSVSLKHKKIAKRTCYVHACKRIRTVDLSGVGYLFFGLTGLIYKKRTFWSLLSHFRLSKHEMENDFAFIRLIKPNDGIPYLGTNPSFLRFIKYVRMNSLLDELRRVFVTLFGLVKTKKRHSYFEMGKLKESKKKIICIYGNLQSTFEHGTCPHLHI